MGSGLRSLQRWLIPAAEGLVNVAAEAGLSPLVTSARRSHAQQALLYRRFLAGQSRFPAAPPGNSAHELGLAFDLKINDESALPELGRIWEENDGTWGGRFKDPIHFEAGGLKNITYAQAAATDVRGGKVGVPVEGSAIYMLVDLLSGFVPGLGQVQLAESIATMLGSDQDKAGWYLQHPAEAIRDLLS